MKKIICISLISIIIIIAIVVSKDNNIFEINGIKYAVSIDEKEESKFPDRGSYEVTVSCDGGEGIWNYKDWSVEIESQEGNVYCDVSFEPKDTTVYLNNYIKDTLTGTTQGDGQVVNENGYRYEGKNPNNYIWFNNELWRIIGVFGEESHGQAGEYLTKIIRKNSIGRLGWDVAGQYYVNPDYMNDWSKSTLYTLLNNNYYNATDGTNDNSCQYIEKQYYEDAGEGAYTIVKKPQVCDYRKKGIQNEYRSMIKNVTWYLGGYESYSVSVNDIYNYERSIDNTYYYKDNNHTVTGYIGLMYVSDYAYSVLSSSCDREDEMDVNSSFVLGCLAITWLNDENAEWTITHNSSTSVKVFAVNSRFKNEQKIGNTNNIMSLNYYDTNYSSNTHSGNAVRPTLYLDSSVSIITGDGTLTNPYIIGIN